MLHQLAEERGWINVDAMARSITARQFLELLVYKRMEPFRELRADYRIASIVQMLGNVNRAKGQKAFTLEDFLLKFDTEAERPRQTREQQIAVIRAIAKVYSEPTKDVN